MTVEVPNLTLHTVTVYFKVLVQWPDDDTHSGPKLVGKSNNVKNKLVLIVNIDIYLSWVNAV